MKKLKFAVAATIIAVGVVGAFAFNADEKEPVKEDVQTFYYRVDAISGTDYQIHAIQMPSNTCPGGGDACEFSSPDQLGSSVPKSDVDNEENGIVLLAQQDL